MPEAPFTRLPILEDVLDSLQRFPVGSQVSLRGGVIYTPRTYKGECCFDVFADALPDWSEPDPKSDSDYDATPNPETVLTYINRQLHGGTCPTPGSWGECPAISRQWGHNRNQYWIAHVYWWKTPATIQTVKDWIEFCGFECYRISQTIWDSGDTPSETDTVAWDVSFGPKEQQ